MRLEAGAETYLGVGACAGGVKNGLPSCTHGLRLQLACTSCTACTAVQPFSPHVPAPIQAGALAPATMKAVHASVNGLCRQLGADRGRLALALCDGFGTPDHLLQAPIAVRGGDWRQFQGS